MDLYQLRDFLLSLPWLGILIFAVLVIGVILALGTAPGRARLMDFAYRVLDALLPNREAAKERAEARDITYWREKE